MTERWKVLIIDDDAGIRRVTALALEDTGFDVITAPDGPTGLELCRTEAPQIVITDVGMPGMDGLEVLRRIKDMGLEAEVIVSTAFTEIGLAIRAMQLDACGFVTKPVSEKALATALRRAQQRHRQRRDLYDYTSTIEERWMTTAEALARTFQYQKMLIEGSIDGIVACDKDGKIIIFNPSMETLSGYSKSDMIGKFTVMQLFAPGEAGRILDELYAMEAPGLPSRLFPFETRLTRNDGLEIPVRLSLSVLYEGEEQSGMVVFFRDLRQDLRTTLPPSAPSP
jgi:two-component system, NtrC family, sensor kinase